MCTVGNELQSEVHQRIEESDILSIRVFYPNLSANFLLPLAPLLPSLPPTII